MIQELTSMGTKRRCRFTAEEDDRLRKLIAELGPNAWPLVSKSMPERSARQCRDRWCSYLSDWGQHTAWTPQEDRLLLEKIDQYGPHWARIARDLPNRSGLAVKRRWSQIFLHNRTMLIHEAVSANPRRKSGAGQRAGNELEPAHSSDYSPWISWDEAPAEAFRESMNE
jgi:hypothetical protein